jgi:cytochrome c biogenesis protein CcdA
MLEELFAAFIVGISFSNAFMCIFMAFGITTAEQRTTGVFFILGRFLGLIILGLIIASFGVIFSGYIIYLLIIFGILTIIFGAIVISKMYLRIKNKKSNPEFFTHSNDKPEPKCSQPDGKKPGKFSWLRKPIDSKKNSRRYGFMLGVFRGATPCLKIFILAPLLIIVDIKLAFLMILVYALASTIYPVIGFLSASLLTNVKRYEPVVQITGAIILISIGAFTIINQLFSQNCPIGI